MPHTEDQNDERRDSDSQCSSSPNSSRRIRQYAPSSDGDVVSPMMLGKNKPVDDFNLDKQPKRHHRSLRKHLVGRGSRSPSPTRPSHGLDGSGTLPFRSADSGSKSHRHHSHHHGMSSVLDEVTAWLKAEKAKKNARSAKRKVKRGSRKTGHGDQKPTDDSLAVPDSRRSSMSSEGSGLDLGKLEAILEKGMRSNFDLSSSSFLPTPSSSTNLHRVGSRPQKVLRRASTLKPADTDTQDEDVFVPGCDAVLDNSKTFAHYIGTDSDVANGDEPSDRDARTAWQDFKHETLRIAHTLQLSRWRHIPMSLSNDIKIERLSGALTNAVYVVTPPDPYDPNDYVDWSKHKGGKRKYPNKLLLRIYGAQTAQLIDRTAELAILARLAKKHIGPCLLGTFSNGRFEEYLHAHALKFEDLRQPDTSRQIAKRFRELHDGIEVLEEERNAGPFIWRNWDKIVGKAEKVMSFVDQQTASGRRASKIGLGKSSKPSGYVCGTSWPVFRKTVDLYRKKLEHEYGGADRMNDQMVFAHNDAQYGNILRLDPPGESPLLMPINAHKQLVVIDFEYANANVPGVEFANHFTEWCYNYHDPNRSYICDIKHYPTMEEQIRFLRTYVDHRPSHNPAAPSTPRFTPLHSTGSFTSLDLDKMPAANEDPRRPQSSYFQEAVLKKQLDHEKAEADAATHDEVRRLLRETQLWRIANSAQWVVWGILQAPIPGMPDDLRHEVEEGKGNGEPMTDSLDAEDQAAKEDMADKRPEPEEGEDDAEFDYLAYSRDRAMFFWGDCLQMGLVTEEELGKDLVAATKVVPY